jgi:sporulation protein YlmC with PRC-barrel domain
MKTILFDSLDEAGAQKLAGCKVVDESGKVIGAVDGLWMDSTSRRVEFVGVKSNSSSGKVHVVPAQDAQIIEEGYLKKVRYPSELIAKTPSFSPGAELEEALKGPNLNKGVGAAGRSEDSTDREDLEKSDQAFFNQSGLITDSMPEVDASRELLRSQNEAKARNREDRIKTGSLD